MLNRIVIIAMAIMYSSYIYSQAVSYRVLITEATSSANVSIEMIVYGKSKKTIDHDAQCAALRVVLFDGCPNTPYSKALLEDGEATSSEKFPQYFESLYSARFPDFISFCEASSAFKKGDKNKGTKYKVEVKVLNLRKDLEENHIRRKIGL